MCSRRSKKTSRPGNGYLAAWEKFSTKLLVLDGNWRIPISGANTNLRATASSIIDRRQRADYCHPNGDGRISAHSSNPSRYRVLQAVMKRIKQRLVFRADRFIYRRRDTWVRALARYELSTEFAARPAFVNLIYLYS